MLGSKDNDAIHNDIYASGLKILNNNILLKGKWVVQCYWKRSVVVRVIIMQYYLI